MFVVFFPDQSSLMETGYSILMDSRSVLAAKKTLMQTEYEVEVNSVSALNITASKNDVLDVIVT